MKTAITELLGIEMPILLPGMSWISTPELVAAVSNAGGLGILASGPLTPVETKEAIAKIRQLTDKPFGIGITLLMPGAEANADIAIGAVLAKYQDGASLDDLDGVSLAFADWRFNLRKSNTEPLVRLNVETSGGAGGIEARVAAICEKLLG